MYSCAPADTCLPTEVSWPVIGRTKPTLTVSCAVAVPAANTTAAHVAKAPMRHWRMVPSPHALHEPITFLISQAGAGGEERALDELRREPDHGFLVVTSTEITVGK